MRRKGGKKRKGPRQPRLRINESIRASELRIIHEERGNLGVMTFDAALQMAQDEGLDLIEISPDAKPPVAKITDYGQFQYDAKKRLKALRQSATNSEVKSVQIKIATSENDIALKAKRASEWLKEGHRIKAELFLRGRSKYMDKEFLHERLNRILALLTVNYKVVDDFKKSPRGIAITIERDKSKKVSVPKAEKLKAKQEQESKSSKEAQKPNEDASKA